MSDDVLLLEKIIPGDQMWAVEDYRERARLMGNTVKDLAILYLEDRSGDNSENEKYPTYLSWMEDLRAKLIDMWDLEDILFYLDKAIETYKELKQHHNKKCLLHGDLHQENMLLNEKGDYTIIDPKGVVDDPVMETARFLLNEIPCKKSKILEMAGIMSPVIGISVDDILKSLFVDTALSNCWCMEEHFATKEAFKETKQNVLEICRFVYDIINEKSQ